MSHLFLLLAGLGATHHHVSWLSCRSDTGCHRYQMPRETRQPLGMWHACTTSPAITVCMTYPTWTRHIAPKPSHRAILPVKATTRTAPIIRATVRRVDGVYYLYTTYFCLTGHTASGRMAGPGIVASYILPWGAHVRDTVTGYEGYVWDHPDFRTAADEWLSCPRAFPTGVHKWEVIP